MLLVTLGIVGSAPNPLVDIEKVVTNLLGVATSIIGIALFVMFLVGSFQYLTAGSDEKKAEQARATFTYAAMGGAALILLYFTFLLLRQLTGLNLLKFQVCITGRVGSGCQ